MYECKKCTYVFHNKSGRCTFCGSGNTEYFNYPNQKKGIIKKKEAKRIISRWGL